MTINRRHLTRALMIAALAAGTWTASEAADTTAAHAADKPRPAAEQSRGLLGRAGRLPDQAADRAREVVEQATEPEHHPEQSEEQPEPEPGDEPAPEPTEPPDRPRDEPTPDEPAPTTPTPSLPEPTLPNPGDVVDKVEDVVEQMPLPPMPEQPPAEPVDKTDRDDGPLIPLPLPLAPIGDPVQVEVLTPIGPAPAAQLPLDGVPLELYPRGIRAAETPVCEDEQPDPERDYERGHVRRILDRTSGLPPKAKHTRPLKPCPDGPAGHADKFTGLTATHNTAQNNLDQQSAVITATAPADILDCIEGMRARAAIPTGRSVHVEPGPA